MHTKELAILVSGIIRGGKEKDKARQAVFLTPLNPFGKDPEEDKPHSDYTVPQKAPYETTWKRNQDAVYWVRLKKAQDQGSELWQTKSFAIMTYFTIPGECIDRVTAQHGDRVLFERLATPRPAPKVTLKRNYLEAEGDLSQKRTKPPGHATSDMNVDTLLSDKEVSPDALVKNEAVKAEPTDTNTKAMKQLKLVQIIFVFTKIWRRRKWCLAKNPAKLSSRWVKWSSLKTSMIQCPSCLHKVFKGTFFADAESTSDPTWI